MIIRMDIYGPRSDQTTRPINTIEFTPAKTKNGKFDYNTQTIFDEVIQSLHSKECHTVVITRVV